MSVKLAIAPSELKPTPAELVARAKAMFPLLRANNARAEELRKIPDEVIAACREAGFFNILKPALYGGYEYEPQVMLDVLMEIAKASSAAGWVAGLLIVHNWEIGLCDPRIAEEIWGKDPEALISSSYASFGKGEKVDGGYVVNGRWAWSSGSDHCQWAVLGTRHPNPLSPIGFNEKVMIIPRTDYEVDQDSWHMAGMQGTGSKDVVVKDAFVPEHRHHDVTDAFFHDHRPGGEIFTAKTYRYPFGIVFAWTLAAVMIGSADGAIQIYTDAMMKKRHAYTGQEVKRDPYNQQRLAEAVAMSYAARASLYHDFSEMSAALDADGVIGKDRRIFYKWNAAYHARTSSAAITAMIKAAGGGAFALGHELQRFFRDTQAGGNHAFINPDKGAGNYGWFLFSGEIEDFVI